MVVEKVYRVKFFDNNKDDQQRKVEYDQNSDWDWYGCGTDLKRGSYVMYQARPIELDRDKYLEGIDEKAEVKNRF